MKTKRTYFISNSDSKFDTNSNYILNLDIVDLNIFRPYKLINSYKITKKKYLSIYQTIINNNKQTYTEDFNTISFFENKLIVEYTKNILDDNEFPSLNKYDFEETYDEEIYEIIYNNKKAKLVKNKYEVFIEEL